MRSLSLAAVAAICTLVPALILFQPAHVLSDTEERVHVVQKGDTLWDISSYYLYDPFVWPQVWNVNRDIENPHLIYPGQRILIPSAAMIIPPRPVEAKPALPPPPKPVAKVEEPKPVTVPEAITHELIEALATHGFIVDKNEIGLGTISSMEEDRMLISTGQKVYVTTPEEAPLEVGERYSIVRVFDEVRHPRTDEKVGYLARILGDLSVVAANGDLSTAMVGEVYREVQLGDNVMKHIQYVTWHRKRGGGTEPGIEGYVLVNPDGKRLMGRGDVLFLDIGTDQGLRTGDVLNILAEMTGKPAKAPPEVIGQIEIVIPREKTSLAKVTESSREIGPGARTVSPTP
ncbi:MAG: LysM peptidoglycan-binding domain-containing protein [bacterium]|nr:MAG: LysM peptidoglycan-binding domain-containing protein [bacterium]